MIGEYKQALRGISPVMANVLDTGSQLRDGLIKQKAAMEASAVATGTTSKALRIFKLALISTGIGAIVVVLGSLIAYLKTTQAGIDAVTRVTKPLQAIFQSLLGVVQTLGKDMFEAFTNPKKLLTDLSDFVKTNLINRFKAFSVVLEGIINLDFKKVANGVLQFGSGVEDVIGKTQKLGKNTSEFFGTAIEKGNKLRQIGIDIEKAEANLAINRAKITDEIRKQELISKDKSKSDTERAKSVEEALRLSKQLAEEEKSIINLKIEEEDITQSLNDSGRKDLGKLNALKAEAIDKDTQQKATELRFLGVKNQLEREGIAQTQKLKDENFQKSQQQMSEELELFLAMQSTKAKTLSEEVAIAQKVADEKTKILDAQLAAGKISQTKYNTDILTIGQELAAKQAELAIENAFIQAEADKLRIDQTILNEQDKNNQLLEVEKEYQAQRLALGEISQTEYNALINGLNEENRLSNIELEKERAEIDKENRLEAEQLSFEESQQRRRDELEAQKQLELEAAEKSGANKNLIEAKFKQQSVELERQLTEQKFAIASKALGALSDALGKESKAGKAIALAQALINTYQGITAELATKTVTPFEIGLKLANVATVAAIGFKAVKNITATKMPKAARGAMIEGLPHAQGGTIIEAERGEAIINANSVSRFKPLLSAINQSGGGVSFGATGSTQNELINYDAMARAFGNAISAMPAPQVAVTEINEVSKNYTKVLERANI
jgi:uncharacterized membrane protein